MLNFLLNTYNSGVVDAPSSGSGSPDGVVGSFEPEVLIWAGIALVIGILIGYGIRSLIQAIKDAPSGDDKQDK